MTIRLRDNTPPAERLRPPASETELRWFRKKRRAATARAVLFTCGMSALYFAGSLLRESHRAGGRFLSIALGFIVLGQGMFLVNAVRSVNLVKEIQAKRSAMYDEQRKRVFLAALDDDIPVD
ncbi:hypothetical protein BH09GEM1_BH09GEM1_19350 [soil metagenome]